MENWLRVTTMEEIPPQGSRVIRVGENDIALFRTADNEVFALRDKCPHKGGPLSQGMVCGKKVTCPLHGWNIGLADGLAVAPDKGCAHTIPVRIDQGDVFIGI